MKTSRVPYERWVQWLAGPVSMIVGWFSTQLVNHANLLGGLGFTSAQIETVKHYTAAHLATASNVHTVAASPLGHDILNAVVFAASALATYAAHHKWLSNLAEYWHVQPNTLTSTAIGDGASAEAAWSWSTAATASDEPSEVPSLPAMPSQKTEDAAESAPVPDVDQPTETLASPVTPGVAETLRKQLQAAGLTPAA